MGSEQIGLEGNPVTVATGQLQHGLESGIKEQAAEGEAAHPHHCPAAIGDIDGMDQSAQLGGHGEGSAGVASPRRGHLSRDRELTGLQGLAQKQGTGDRSGPIMRQRLLLTVGQWRCGVWMSDRDNLIQLRSSLSERELEIIERVATGLTNQEIALELMISKRTVDNHVSNIFTKTGAKNRVALLNWAMDNGKICRDGFNCCNLPNPEG
jgi:DNA-binding CsgD family transcriptional regulator